MRYTHLAIGKSLSLGGIRSSWFMNHLKKLFIGINWTLGKNIHPCPGPSPPRTIYQTNQLDEIKNRLLRSQGYNKILA